MRVYFAVLPGWMPVLPKLNGDSHLKCVKRQRMWCANYRPFHNLGLTIVTGHQPPSWCFCPVYAPCWFHHGHAVLPSTASWDPSKCKSPLKSRLTSLSLNSYPFSYYPRVPKTPRIMGHLTVFSAFSVPMASFLHNFLNALKVRATSSPSYSSLGY